MCKASWTAPLAGTASKAGTPIHEMSPFDAVANTDDVGYRQSGAKALAINTPPPRSTPPTTPSAVPRTTPSQN